MESEIDAQQCVLSSRAGLAAKGAWIGVTLRLHPDQVATSEKVTRPVSEVEVTLPAIIDTGATFTCIRDTIAVDLGFRLVDTKLISGVHDQEKCAVYLADIQIGPWREPWKVVGLKSQRSSPIPCILGRDILQFFTLFYVGPEERFGLYHGVPSVVRDLMAKSPKLPS